MLTKVKKTEQPVKHSKHTDGRKDRQTDGQRGQPVGPSIAQQTVRVRPTAVSQFTAIKSGHI